VTLYCIENAATVLIFVKAADKSATCPSSSVFVSYLESVNQLAQLVAMITYCCPEMACI
jgi:hypothetical protein